MKLRLAMLAGLSLAMATPARAQLQGMPVYFSPKGGTGITIDGDFGRVSSSKFGTLSSTGHPTTIGGRVYAGMPFLTVGVGAASYDSDVTGASNETQFMGSLALKVLGGPLVPVAVSLQAGAGYLKFGTGTTATKVVSVPIGVGVALNIPTPGASLEPWLAGRVQISATSSGTTSSTRAGPGFSGGISLGLPMGLGAHVAFDWAKLSGKASSPVISDRVDYQALTIGVGVHYMIRLGVPLVPGI